MPDPTATSGEAKNLKHVLESKHKLVKEFEELWKMYARLYDGGRAVQDLLVKHQRETQEAFEIRKKRTFYINYARPVVDTYLAFLFRKPIVRSEKRVSSIQDAQTSDDLRLFYENVDLHGHRINDFMKLAHQRAAIFGHSYICVDMPFLSGTDYIHTEHDRVVREHRPYLYRIDPTNVTNWALDDIGELLWIRWIEPAPGNEDPYKETLHKTKCRVRTWSRTGWTLYEILDDDVRLLKSGPNQLGVVPVVKHHFRRSVVHEECGLGALTDIALVNLAIYQWSSLLDEELHQKVMNILTMQGIPNDTREEIDLSARNVLTYYGQVPPAFISPSSMPAEMIMASIDRMGDYIWRLARLSRDGSSAASGIANAFEFNETNQILAEQADALENTEEKIHDYYRRWMNGKWEGVIDYPDEFGVELFQDELATVQSAVATIKSGTFSKLMLAKTARKFLPKEQPELLQKIVSEISETVEAAAQMNAQLQQQAVAEGKQSTAAQQEHADTSVGNQAGGSAQS